MFWRVVLWGLGLIFIPIYSLIGILLLNTEYTSWKTMGLYERVVRDGQVPATSLEDSDWDRMCVATGYCGGPGDLSDDICDSFQDDGVWGPVFFKENKVTSIHRMNSRVRYKETKLCFSRKDNPVFVKYNHVHYGRMLTAIKGVDIK